MSAKQPPYQMTALEGEPPSLPEIVTRYLAGESMQVLAKECKKSRRTLYRWILAECGGEQYRELVTECLVARIADADDEMEDARLSGDPVRVAATREMQRFYRMDFERRRPNLYGAKPEHVGGGITVIVDRSCGGQVSIEAPGGSKVVIGNPGAEALPPLAAEI